MKDRILLTAAALAFAGLLHAQEDTPRKWWQDIKQNTTFGGYVIGKAAFEALKESGPERRLVGIELADKAIPRAGYPVEADGTVIGEVTTGYNSISTGKSVCMAFVRRPYSAEGTQVGIRIRKKVFPGTVCKKRFYGKKYHITK